MKKLFIILLSALSLTAFAQQKKTVAILDPISRDNSVNAFFQQMVRGAMESAVTSSIEYEAYDRSAFDLIQKEQAFQRTGAVNDSLIKKMGEMAGVDYVLVSEVSAYDNYLAVVLKILNITTGKYDKSIDDFMQLSPNEVRNKSKEMASSIFRKSPIQTHSSVSNSRRIPVGYVDLGLPSGTLWKNESEKECYSYKSALSKFANSLPSKSDYEELIKYCTWRWANGVYILTGPSGQSIRLRALGSIKNNILYNEGSTGEYWTSNYYDTNDVWCMVFSINEKKFNYQYLENKNSVCLILK